ncbi:MAG: nitrate reductase, partial [Gammaproteobacteria bacterium]
MSYVYTFLFYAATVLLAGGLARKIFIYAKTPAPLKIPTTPAPVTRTGVVYRMFKEVVLFESLFKGNKPTWLFAFLFHFGLLLVLIRHTRYFVEHVPAVITMTQWTGVYAGMAMVAGLLGLFGRRIVVDRVRYISSPSD